MANYSELMSETAHQLGGSPMGVKEDAVNCAETDGSTLFYSASFMSDLESAAGTDGIRFVIAHELGHQVGGMDTGGHAGEFMADAYAARALAHSGASFGAIERVFSFLGGPGSETHPSSSSRVEAARSVYTNARADLAEIPALDHVNVKDNTHEHDLEV